MGRGQPPLVQNRQRFLRRRPNSRVAKLLLAARTLKGDNQIRPRLSGVRSALVAARVEGDPAKVRLIGVDAPETIDPPKPVGFFGKEASAFTHAPPDIATCMWYTGIDPFTKKPVQVARHLGDRKLQRALMQFFKPENWFNVREALIEAGRQDLIGSGCDCLISSNPPKEALEARRKRVDQQARGEEGDHYHTVANPARGEKPDERGLTNRGYRPGRKSKRRRQGKQNGGPNS